MTKIDRAHKNYLTAEIWEETHLRAPVRKNQTYRGKGGKFDFFHILMLDRLGYN